MKKLELSQMAAIEGGKFWGTGTVTDCYSNPLNGCQICTTCSRNYVFWIPGSPYDCKNTSPACG